MAQSTVEMKQDEECIKHVQRMIRDRRIDHLLDILSPAERMILKEMLEVVGV